MRPLLLLFLFAPQAQAEDAKPSHSECSTQTPWMDEGSRHLTPDHHRQAKTRNAPSRSRGHPQAAHTLVRFAEPAELGARRCSCAKNRAARRLSFCTNRPTTNPSDRRIVEERALYGDGLQLPDFEKRDTDEGIYRFGEDKVAVKRPAVSST